MIKLSDELVLNLMVSACRYTLGDEDRAMAAGLLVVAQTGSWASLMLAGKPREAQRLAYEIEYNQHVVEYLRDKRRNRPMRRALGD